MKSSQSVVIERLQQAQNAHDLEASLACFHLTFKVIIHSILRGPFRELSMSVRIDLPCSTTLQTFTQS